MLFGQFAFQMDYTISFPEKNVKHWTMNRCWAHKSVKKLGGDQEYKCGVLWRVQCWMKALGAKFEMDPPVKTCLLHEQDRCEGDFRFFLD